MNLISYLKKHGIQQHLAEEYDIVLWKSSQIGGRLRAYSLFEQLGDVTYAYAVIQVKDGFVPYVRRTDDLCPGIGCAAPDGNSDPDGLDDFVNKTIHVTDHLIRNKSDAADFIDHNTNGFGYQYQAQKFFTYAFFGENIAIRS